MAKVIHSEFTLGSILLRYLLDTETRRMGLQVVPENLSGDLVVNRESLNETFEVRNLGIDCPAWNIDSLVNISLISDSNGDGFAQGLTMRNSSSDLALSFREQRIDQTENGITIDTILEIPARVEVIHTVSWTAAEPWFRVGTKIINTGDEDIILQNLSSFSLGHMSPFDADDSPENLMIHRLRSYWSAEGSIRSESAEDLGLVPSWSGHGVRCERFGQIGSMPVRGWFPFAAIEDVKRKVIWGAQLEWSGSWQMELYRRDDYLSLSGGLADREFGHWYKKIEPGASFSSPSAIISTVQGCLDDLFYNLTRSQDSMVCGDSAVETGLPIIFNEWCTSWGNPNHDELIKLADRLKGTPVKYLVIDAGWYCQPGRTWEDGHGDWILSEKSFPDGMNKVVEEIKSRGLVPGIWFEMETIGTGSEASGMIEYQLHRDGVPVTSGKRRFWDFRKPETIRHLKHKIIDFIAAQGFGYLKVDYNETIGFGVDGAESPGEGLRQHIDSVHEFWQLIHSSLPGLVVENCSSGGHRLEPMMIGLSSMSSFSDAHEGLEIPVLAANISRIVLPRKSQIWAVLRVQDSPDRLYYSLSATFLGRMCLSGDICDLDARQWEIVQRGMNFYKKIEHIIIEGRNTIRRSGIVNYRHLTGWQCVVREDTTSRELLVVVHAFPGCPDELDIPIQPVSGEIIEIFGSERVNVSLNEGVLTLGNLFEYAGVVLHIKVIQDEQ